MRISLGSLFFALLLAFPTFVRADTVATVAGDSISRDDVEKRVRPQLIEVENNRYEILEQGLNEAIAEKLLEKEAKSRGVSVSDLRKTEIEAKVPPPSDEDVQKLFDQGPLPRASLKSQHYETITGADTLALGLVELHLHILAITAVRCPPNTIDR